MADDERTVHEFPKGEREVVGAVLSTFNGRRYMGNTGGQEPRSRPGGTLGRGGGRLG